jgi:hypothetical protein
MPIDREVIEAVREMDEHELRRLLILAKARLEQRGVAFPGAAPDVKLRAQHVRCGKAACTRCPHGPYWYAYWWEDGRRRSRYVGKLDDLDSRETGFSRPQMRPEALPSLRDG